MLSFAGAEASRTYCRSVSVLNKHKRAQIAGEETHGLESLWVGGGFTFWDCFLAATLPCFCGVSLLHFVYSKATGHGRTYGLGHRGHGEVGWCRWLVGAMVVMVRGRFTLRTDLIWCDC